MNKVWLVIGSASGLGRNIAEAVLESGDRLVAHARATVTLSTSSGRTVNLNHVLGYNTSGSSTLFFRFGRTHITPG